MPVSLRYYQEAAITETLQAFRGETASALLCLATGTGKTLTTAELIRRLGVGRDGRTVLWLAHQDELLDQAHRAIARQIPNVSLGFEAGARRSRRENQVIFSSVQSLAGARGARLLHSLRDRLVLMVIDEAHRSAAATYRHLIHAVRAGCPRGRILGLTATPNRTDKVTLADLYDDITYSYSTRDAIFDGYLVSPRGFRVTTTTSLRGVTTRGGDFATGELAKRLNTDERNTLALRAWNEYAHKTKTLGFCVGIEHAEACASLFSDNGIRSAAVHGKLSPAERTRRFAAFRRGELTVLFGDQLFVEGFDDPSVETALFLKRSKSSIYYQQSLGRVLRPSDDVAMQLAATESREARLHLIERSAKPFARVIDLVDLNSNGVMELATLFAPRLAEGSRQSLRQTAEEKAKEQAEETTPEKSVGVRTIERHDALSAAEIIIEPFDLLAAESALAAADAESPFVWRTERPGERRLFLPRMPIGIRSDGSRSKPFEYAYAAAYQLPQKERLERALTADPHAVVSSQDTSLSIVANASGQYRVLETYTRRNEESVTRELGTASSAADAVTIAQRHIVTDYRHLIKLLDKQAPWRSQPTKQALKDQLRELGLNPEDYPTAGDATDAIAQALANVSARAS